MLSGEDTKLTKRDALRLSEEPPAVTFPPLWFVTDGLRNARHWDSDSDRCFAGWWHLPRARIRTHACLLFPDHGVAIRLSQGTVVSWVGQQLRHCTSGAELLWKEAGRQRKEAAPTMISLFCGRNAQADRCATS